MRRSFASPDGRKALIELVPKENATPVELMRFVDELRAVQGEGGDIREHLEDDETA